MGLRQLAKLFVPPIGVELYRRMHFSPSATAAVLRSESHSAEWEYIPEGWGYSQTHPEVKGWDVSGVLETYKRKWPKYVAMVQGTGSLGFTHESDLTSCRDIYSHNTVMSFAYVLALSAYRKEKILMLDWGGGIGHYYVLAQKLMPETNIEYHCKDVPLLAGWGGGLFPEQHFHADETCLGDEYDLIIASGSLQFSEHWQQVLSGLAGATSGYLYVANLPVVEKAPSFVFVQRPYNYGYNTEYLAWCLNARELLESAARLGLRLVREFEYGYAPTIHNAPEQNAYRGYLFVKSGNSEKK